MEQALRVWTHVTIKMFPMSLKCFKGHFIMCTSPLTRSKSGWNTPMYSLSLYEVLFWNVSLCYIWNGGRESRRMACQLLCPIRSLGVPSVPVPLPSTSLRDCEGEEVGIEEIGAGDLPPQPVSSPFPSLGGSGSKKCWSQQPALAPPGGTCHPWLKCFQVHFNWKCFSCYVCPYPESTLFSFQKSQAGLESAEVKGLMLSTHLSFNLSSR